MIFIVYWIHEKVLTEKNSTIDYETIANVEKVL